MYNGHDAICFRRSVVECPRGRGFSLQYSPARLSRADCFAKLGISIFEAALAVRWIACQSREKRNDAREWREGKEREGVGRGRGLYTVRVPMCLLVKKKKKGKKLLSKRAFIREGDGKGGRRQEPAISG